MPFCQRRRTSLGKRFFIATASFETIKALPFDILVESTGIPDVGARYAEAALLAGKHVGIATKETESVVGPYLTRLAYQQGRVFTPMDGDQPSLLIGLLTWARTLGFEIIAAGKSSEYDFIWDEANATVECNGVRYPAAGLSDLWELPPRANARWSRHAAACWPTFRKFPCRTCAKWSTWPTPPGCARIGQSFTPWSCGPPKSLRCSTCRRKGYAARAGAP